MRSPSLEAVPALLEAPRGFLRGLVESRLLAVVLGVTALVILGLWLVWQLSALQESEAGDVSSDSDSPS